MYAHISWSSMPLIKSHMNLSCEMGGFFLYLASNMRILFMVASTAASRLFPSEVLLSDSDGIESHSSDIRARSPAADSLTGLAATSRDG